MSKTSIIPRESYAQAYKAATSELVQAWARDIQTGEPRYILELDAEHRGALCGCECPSCGLPLTGVNVAKSEFSRRPHFRHPEGSAKDNCAVLSARTAALRLLSEQGMFDLPRRRMSAAVAGLTGQLHEAWVEAPAEKVRIDAIDFQDRTFALLTLQDGRQLRVQLTGTLAQTDQPLEGGLSAHIPVIFLDVNDASIAAMDPEQIRGRLQLLPEALCWRSHWSDAALIEQAMQAACRLAEENLDWCPDADSLLQDVLPELRRETLLHLTVKRILEAAGGLWVPEMLVSEEAKVPGLPLARRQWRGLAERLHIRNASLEQRSGRIIPDVACEARQDGSMLWDRFFIEVTVTNAIGQERLDRIRGEGIATLEIDLSLAGGRVTRHQLEHLVVSELRLKRWLYHPELERQRQQLREQLARGLAEDLKQQQALDERRRFKQAEDIKQIQATPTGQVRCTYLAAVEQFLVHQAQGYAEAAHADAEPRKRLDKAIEAMLRHGFPQANDHELIGHQGLLAGLLSIRHGRCIGFRQETLTGALEVIRMADNRKYWSIYLIAIRAYKPQFNAREQQWVERWAEEVRTGVRNHDEVYLRPATFDATLSHLFPEMALALAKPMGKFTHKKPQYRDGPSDTSPHARLAALRQQHAQQELQRAAAREDANFWLKGAELQAWRRANPESAKAWDQIARGSGNAKKP